MHLALVTAYPPSRGSINEYGYHFARALAANPRVTRLSIVADTLDTAHVESHDIHRCWTFNDPRNALRIARTLERLQPDGVVFSLQFASFGDRRIPAALGLLAPWLSRRRRPTITLLHNLFETVDLDSAGFGASRLVTAATRKAGEVFTRILLASDRVAVTMPRYVDILQRKYGAGNVFHAPHGSFELPREVAPLPETPTVMTFGKFGTYKRIEVLLEAHARLLERCPQVRLVVAGSDSPNAQGYLASMQARYRHLPNLDFTGYVAEEDVPGIFAAATVVAFPYESTTGSSGVLHQAGQFGRAAVLPRIGDLGDLVLDEGYRAGLFERGDVEGLAAALGEFLFNDDRARSSGLANHRAASGITLDDVVELYLQQFERLQERAWTSSNTRPTADTVSS